MPPPAGGAPVLRLVGGLAMLVVFFGAGAYLYVHVAGSVAGHSSRVPAPLLLALALLGGAASFFSPCSIAITPSFISYLASSKQAARAPSRTRLLAPAGLVAAGIVVFYAAAGTAVGAIGAAVYNYLVYLLPAVAVGFFALGYLLLTGGASSLTLVAAANPANRLYQGALRGAPNLRSRARLFGFGCAYGAASHSCTLPIFLGIVLAPIASGDFALAAAATLLYGLAIAAILMVLAIVGEGALSGLGRRLAGHYLGLATGGLFVLTGGYLLYYFVQNYGGLL